MSQIIIDGICYEGEVPGPNLLRVYGERAINEMAQEYMRRRQVPVTFKGAHGVVVLDGIKTLMVQGGEAYVDIAYLGVGAQQWLNADAMRDK